GRSEHTELLSSILLKHHRNGIRLLPCRTGSRPNTNGLILLRAGKFGYEFFFENTKWMHIPKPQGLVGRHGIDNGFSQPWLRIPLHTLYQLRERGNFALCHDFAQAAANQVLLVIAQQDTACLMQKVAKLIVIGKRAGLRIRTARHQLASSKNNGLAHTLTRHALLQDRTDSTCQLIRTELCQKVVSSNFFDHSAIEYTT